MKKEAKFYKSLKNKMVQCSLCHHGCKIGNSQIGVCGVRKNENGKLHTLIYGSCSSIAVDPIEKKPLYHFYPGSSALSFGTVGCNFKCLHCQNASISRAKPDFCYMKEINPEEVVELAEKSKCRGIAWTYNEPTIWHEFTFDSSKLAKKKNLYIVYVSNGYIQEDPLKEISPYLDAINVDVKAFTEDFYKKVCKARLQPVLDTCVLVKELDIHLEVTYLIIPGYNDSVDEIKQFCSWIVEKLGVDTPVHFSRFHPDFEMTNIPRTPMETMIKAYNIARDSGLHYTYLGNIPPGEYENTVCPRCKNICIERHGFSVNLAGIKNGKCAKCGNSISVVS